MFLEPLCRRKISEFKISFRGPHLLNKLIAPNMELSNISKFNPIYAKAKRHDCEYPKSY